MSQLKLLIDTHILIWWNGRPERLDPQLRCAIPGASVYLSAASVWEIAVKRSLGKIAFEHPILAVAKGHRFDILPITGVHAEHAGGLPRHHNDPFDRLIIAQAMLDGMTLGTQDPAMRSYGVPTLGLD